MTDKTYSGKFTSPVTLKPGVYQKVVDSILPTEGHSTFILEYVNIRGLLLQGRMGGTLDFMAVRNGATGGTDETAVWSFPVNARQQDPSTGLYVYQAFVPQVWFLANEADLVNVQWRVRPDVYSVKTGTMTTRYAKAWNGQST